MKKYKQKINNIMWVYYDECKIEAYVSTNATCYTDPLAMESIKLVNDLADVIRELNGQVGIPNTLKEITEVDLTEEKFLNVLDRMSQNAFDDPCTGTNPRVPTPEEMKAIYKAAYYGTTTKDI